MNARSGSLLLAGGTLAGVALSLYADLPAAALVAWVAALVGTVALKGVVESFVVASNGAIACAIAELAMLVGFGEGAATWIRFVGVLLLVAGSASAYRTAFGEDFRASAASRIGTLTYLTVIPLALVVALLEAGAGPEWTPVAARALEIAAMVTMAWFAVFVVAARDAVPTEPRGR